MNKKIAVITVAMDRMHTETHMCITSAMLHQLQQGDSVKHYWQPGTVLAEARQDIAKTAIEDGAEWLFWVDSDMTFPVDTIERLLSHGEPFVAANCSKRRRPIGPTAKRRNALISGEMDAVWPDKETTGLEKVDTVGLAVAVTHVALFKRLAVPWFSTPWVDSESKHVGEDVFFCARCAEAGVPIYVDHDLSWAVGHIGDYEFGMKDVLTEKELVETGQWGEDAWR